MNLNRRLCSILWKSRIAWLSVRSEVTELLWVKQSVLYEYEKQPRKKKKKGPSSYLTAFPDVTVPSSAKLKSAALPS